MFKSVDLKSTFHTQQKGGENMTNTALLKEKIKASGYKIGFLASQIGIGEHSLSRKINAKNEFKASEIEQLCKFLKITTKERSEIFFAH
jgi:acyl CoA:acetate/3-ketoacid CoA transferase alpha subunit